MKEPTEDTERALQTIKPLADNLGIDVSADDNFLYCNGQAIGISCNSIYATINEFLGYAFLRMCNREYRFRDSIEEAQMLQEDIRRYWVSDAVLKKMGLKAPEDGYDGDPDQHSAEVAMEVIE